jgi:hypothetical protein
LVEHFPLRYGQVQLLLLLLLFVRYIRTLLYLTAGEHAFSDAAKVHQSAG